MPNLGVLKSERVPPVPLPQRSWGWSNGGVNCNTVAAGTALPNAMGGYYQMTVTPSMTAYWIIEAQILVINQAAQWEQTLFGLRVSPADQFGVVAGTYIGVAVHSAVGWRSYSTSYGFALLGGTTYTASLTHEGAGGNIAYHTSYTWTRLSGLLIGEGASGGPAPV